MIPRLKYQKINVPAVGSTIEGTVLTQEGKSLYVDASPLGLAIIRGYEFNAARNFIKDLHVGDKVNIKVLELDNELGLIEASLKEASSEKI
jgi:predicted RNA-binding protein with RPS1 domain